MGRTPDPDALQSRLHRFDSGRRLYWFFEGFWRGVPPCSASVAEAMDADADLVEPRLIDAELCKQVASERERREYDERIAALRANEARADTQHPLTGQDQAKREWFERCLAENGKRFREYEEAQAAEMKRNEEIWARKKEQRLAQTTALMQDLRRRRGLLPQQRDAAGSPSARNARPAH
jgi:hypothetical protein